MKRVIRRWHRLSLVTRSLSAAAFLVALFFGLIFPRLGWSPGGTSFSYASLFLRGSSGRDSWDPMVKAWWHMHTTPEIPVYTELFFKERIKFQYPPSSLLILEVFDKLPVQSLDGYALLGVISWICVLLVGALSCFLLARSAKSTGVTNLAPLSKRELPLFTGAFAVLTLLFCPLTKSYVLGQLQTWVTLLGSAALAAWFLGWKRTAGLFIGLACVLKPHWGIVLLWSAIRRQWSTAVTGLVAALSLVVVSALLFGIHHYPDYAKTLSFLSRHGESFYPNQSVNGLVHRLLFNGNNLVWSEKTFPPFNEIVYISTLMSSLVLIILALFWRWRDPKARGPVEFSIVVLSATMASPIAWDHHYAILLPVLAVSTPLVLTHSPFGKAAVPCLATAFVLVSQRLTIVNTLAPTRLNFLQSYLLFGALFLLILLYRTSSLDARRR